MNYKTLFPNFLSSIFVLTVVVWPFDRVQAGSSETNQYMGAPTERAVAPNGAITNRKLLDRISDAAWTEPAIENPAEVIWVFGGYGLAPISVIETEEGLIAFDTGDTKHDGELLLEAIRAVSRLAASGPTSRPCPLRCNEFSDDTFSSATSSSLLLETRCCIDQLKPQLQSGYPKIMAF